MGEGQRVFTAGVDCKVGWVLEFSFELEWVGCASKQIGFFLILSTQPTAFQKKALWTAITALSLTVTGAIAIGLIYECTQVLAFMQPFLVPFAIAGVLAYLLEPGVVWLERRGLTRYRAVLLVFAAFLLGFGGLGWWMVAKVGSQTGNLDTKLVGYAEKARISVLKFADEMDAKYGIDLVSLLPAAPEVSGSSDVKVMEKKPMEGEAVKKEVGGVVEEVLEGDPGDGGMTLKDFLSGNWVKQALPIVVTSVWKTIRSSVGGVLGVFGFLLSMVIIPLYLFYFLIESAKIKATWADYLPLRASAFKDEVVDCLMEINGYLVAFFRGQLFVSVLNGITTGLGLMIVGLDFGLMIGLLLCVLGIIPYLGIAICWIPAVVIAAVQGGSALVPGDPWWMLPLVVTIIFAVVQQIDGLFITPRVVGESVGLHPMTVIVSVLVWSLLLGGLLGAILAVPLTASVKVLFQRYVWLAKLAPQTVGGARQGQSID
jgi:predicted PurR-regulated permease PerM